MSEELLANDRRVERDFNAGIRTNDLPIHNPMHFPDYFKVRATEITQK